MAYLIIVLHEIDWLEAVRLSYCLSVLVVPMGYIENMGTKNRQPSIIEHLNLKSYQLNNAIIQ